MGVLGLKEEAKPNQEEAIVSLGSLAELTGFPIDYIKRELLLNDSNEDELSVEELRSKVLAYLDSNFN